MSAQGKHLPQLRGQLLIQGPAEAGAGGGGMEAKAVRLSWWRRLVSQQREGWHVLNVHSWFSMAPRSPADYPGHGPDGTGCSAAMAVGAGRSSHPKPPPGCHMYDMLGPFIDAHWEAPC